MLQRDSTLPAGRRLIGLAAAAAAILIGVAFGGCARNKPSRFLVPVSGPPISAADEAAVDVRNFNGSVRVFVEPTAKATKVRAVRRAVGENAPKKWKDLDASIVVTADTESADGRSVLRVASQPVAEAQDVAVDLTITMPACNGVLVHNVGGAVELVGVSGAVQVENGFEGRAGGQIDLRTRAPMTGPVALITSEGNVQYQVMPTSTGKFEIVSDDGRAEFSTTRGDVRNARPQGPGRWTGVFNGGTNPVLLRTGRGTARAYVTNNPTEYMADRGGWMFFSGN